MKILRDGKEYELTFSELIEAYNEYRENSAIEDIKNIYYQKDCEVDLTEEQFKEIAATAVHNLSKNENYSEAYWDSLNYTFDNSLSELLEEVEEEVETLENKLYEAETKAKGFSLNTLKRDVGMEKE